MGQRATNERVVGAAGFEPATCSTQNCRATRLRYPPPSVGWIQVSAVSSKIGGVRMVAGVRSVGSVMTAKNRAFNAISGRDAEFARGAGDDFEHRADRSAGRNEPIGERFGIFSNPHDAAVTGDEDHV